MNSVAIPEIKATSAKKFAEERPHILIISHVFPFPGEAGQERRVYFTLRSLRRHFHITFLTYAPSLLIEATVAKLEDTCDEVICLESLYSVDRRSKTFYRGMAAAVSLMSSLKPSNYIIGEVELSPQRVTQAIGDRRFDLVLYEYWHAHKTTAIFRERGIPSVLDMHNILWKSIEIQLKQTLLRLWPLRTRRLETYKQFEESSWRKFDGIISINRVEDEYVRVNEELGQKVFYAPMGIDLESWPYSWKPDSKRPRIAYYGGLGSPHNEASAFACFEKVMPFLWSRFPNAEFWIVGSNPSSRIRSLTMKDGRVKVTGFVEDVQTVLAEMSVVVCPWKGSYGFRSRLVEVMALGVPVVTTKDAIDGMDLKDKCDVLIGDNEKEIAQHALALLEDEDKAIAQSRNARRTVEQVYSVGQTYDRLSHDLLTWLSLRNNGTAV